MSTRINLPSASFLAYLTLHEDKCQLEAVIRKNGQRYQFSGIPAKVFRKLREAKNKGSFAAIEIFHSKKYPQVKMDPIPMAQLEPKFNTATFNFLAR